MTDDCNLTEVEQLEREIRNGQVWTVIGFWHDSWERTAGHYYADSARMAEDMAIAEGNSEGLSLAVVAVLEGEHMPADRYATYVDPEAKDQQEMNRKLRDLGYIK